MSQSLRDSLHVLTNPSFLNGSVEEVFRLMLGVECEQIQGSIEEESEIITSVVGFGGVMSGACVFRTTETSACRMAGLLTGMEILVLDNMVEDALGEMCNMLAGTWKGRIPELTAKCLLSMPAVISGRDYKVHVRSPEFRMHHVYRFEQERVFEVTIICNGMQ